MGWKAQLASSPPFARASVRAARVCSRAALDIWFQGQGLDILVFRVAGFLRARGCMRKSSKWMLQPLLQPGKFRVQAYWFWVLGADLRALDIRLHGV